MQLDQVNALDSRERAGATIPDRSGWPESCYGSEGDGCSVVGQGHQDIDFVPAPVVLNDWASVVPPPGGLQPFNSGSNALVESGRLAPQPDPKIPATGNGARSKL